MSQYKVLKEFVDKDTKVYYATGTIFTCKDSKRVASLQKEKYLSTEVKNEGKEEE
ncbi:hypothetical protein ABEO79_00135 [Micromonospora provocatoris]